MHKEHYGQRASLQCGGLERSVSAWAEEPAEEKKTTKTFELSALALCPKNYCTLENCGTKHNRRHPGTQKCLEEDKDLLPQTQPKTRARNLGHKDIKQKQNKKENRFILLC